MRRLLLAVLAALLLPAAPASAATVFETYEVPTVNGATISVEVMRDDSSDGPVPVLLTYSPYNTLNEGTPGNLANDALGREFVPKGYARAVADVVGTRNSSGCWDYGGPKETRSGVDLVKFLAGRDWANGRVGMIGGSYDGTTATMVASQGAAVPELKAIVPIAAISRWYGYAYGNGVRYFLNSERPTDEGFDTPLAFDFGLTRTPPTNGDGETLVSRADLCDSVEHTFRGYDTTPSYGPFWLERDYRKDAGDIQAAALIAHGWQDYNVKQEEATELWSALDATTPLKRLFLFQDGHGSPSGPEWDTLLDQFLGRFLKDERTGVASTPAVRTQGRTFGDAGPSDHGALTAESAWPPADGRERVLHLGAGGVLADAPDRLPGAATWLASPVSEELTTQAPGGGSVLFESAPLPAATRIAGAPVLDAVVRVPDGGHLTPVLVDVAPDGTRRVVARGFLNVDYRDSLASPSPAAGRTVEAAVRFLPQDVTLAAGHRLGLLVQSANTVWALPGASGAASIATGPGGSRLRIPTAPVR